MREYMGLIVYWLSQLQALLWLIILGRFPLPKPFKNLFPLRQELKETNRKKSLGAEESISKGCFFHERERGTEVHELLYKEP
jgi:hypothetical protein